LERLEQGAAAHLTLVVGVAGAGKTALLADWLHAHPERTVAWLGCDLADADPLRFVAGLIEAFRRAFQEPELGEDALQLLALDGEVSADVVAALVEDMEQTEMRRALVIDDLHLTGTAGADVLATLVDCRPPSLQLVVGSRVDPPLRLHRMRANQELMELRDSDLRFSLEEAGLFLSVFGVQLSDPDLTAVYERSEGWIAGLQMAALSIRQSPDPARSAARVELRRHTVAGYFLDEVIRRQPPDVVDFMLATAVLDELSVPACTALCGEGAAGLLQRLHREHMFVTLIDDDAGTYRYHQLIKEVLQAELHINDPAREARLDESAAQHLASVGQVGLAARHLLAAGDPNAAFRLLSERVILDFSTDPAVGSVLDLVEIQPESFTGAADILVPLAAELTLRGAFERGARALALAQRVAIDATARADLAAQRSVLVATHLGLTGQLHEALAQRDRTRQLGSQVDGLDIWFAMVDVVGMYCHAYLGNHTEARELADSVASAGVTPLPARDILCRGLKSQVSWAEGELAQAQLLATGALDVAQKLGFDRHDFAFPALRTTALLAFERQDRRKAARLVERILSIEGGSRPLFEYLAQVDRARIWAVDGDLEEALSSLPAARAVLRAEQSVLFTEADELEVRLRLALGDLQGARSVTERLPDDRRIVMGAVVALSVRDLQRARAVFGAAPSQGGTVHSELELRLLRAGIAILAGSPHATQLVRAAVALVDRHGFLQSVLDTSPLVVDYLIENSAHFPDSQNLAALIAAGLDARKPSRDGSPNPTLADPLTEAEIRVLEALPQRLTYADMAAVLHLSPNTVKTHLRRSYMKLGVTSRHAAVKRALSLGVI
jgi:LuxR family maltose regulon positive regulatory protein